MERRGNGEKWKGRENSSGREGKGQCRIKVGAIDAAALGPFVK